jgi:hypothetical protein
MADGYVSDGGAKPIPGQSVSDGSFGSEVHPRGYLQDMESSIDLIAGSVHDRDAGPGEFTGGMGGTGLGGVAEPDAPMKAKVP